jgi:hypothetical protein
MGVWLWATAALAGTTRLALLVGANDGGPGRAPLRWAERDAAAVASVLVELGGVDPADAAQLRGPDADALRAAIAALDTRARTLGAAGERVEVVLYYSGHADADGLRLGATTLPYPELRAAFDDLGADAGLLILDACASGAIVRNKGGEHLLPLWGDLANRASGRAVVTSSAATEASQESDAIGGSFFTLALVTGLRGAADRDADQRVSLTEAYDYAFDATRFATAAADAGAQHPSREVQLVGAGDLVVTDLRVPSAVLELDPALAGRLFVRGKDGTLVVEAAKRAGEPLQIHLPEGTFTLTLEANDAQYAGRITVATGSVAQIGRSDLQPVAVEWTRWRGPVDPLAAEQRRRRALWAATGATLGVAAVSAAVVTAETGYFPWYGSRSTLSQVSSTTFVVSGGLSTALLIGAVSNELRRSR